MSPALTMPNGLAHILRKKEIFIYIAILIIGFLFANSLFRIQQRKIRQLRDDIALEERRTIFGKELKAFDKKVSEIVGPYARKADSLTVNKLNRFASDAGVKIVSVYPDKEQDSGFYTVSVFRLKLETGYHGLGKFISILESEPEILKIEDLSLRRIKAAGAADQGSGGSENLLSVSMIITATYLKER